MEEYQALMDQLNEARQMIVDREDHVAKVFDKIEDQMTLLGATGVEDELQDGVPETLEALRAAGIKVLNLNIFLKWYVFLVIVWFNVFQLILFTYDYYCSIW